MIPKRDQRARLGVRLWEGGGKACAACLCFVPQDYLVCSIAFVVYSRVEDLHALYGAGFIPIAYLVVRKTYAYVYVRVLPI